MKIKTLLFLMITLLLFSCKEDEEALSLTNLESDITTPGTESGQPGIDEEVTEEVESTPLVYKFDHLTGKCKDDTDTEGFNLGHLGECGDLSGQTVENSPLNKKNYFGLLLKGSKLVETKISFHKLAKAEVKVDTETEFPDKINAPHTSLFLGHTNAFRGFKKTENKYYQKYLQLRTKFKTLKTEYKAIPRSNVKARAKKMKQIEKIKKQMMAHIKNKKIHKNKSKRQKKYLKGSYKLAKAEDKFINQKVKNKKFLTLDGDSSFTFKESNKVFPTNKTLTISLWFKTDIDQQDKRLINFHRGSNAGSALNLSLKSSKVVLGVHDGGQYHSIETDFEYDDGQWHHFLVTKKKDKFIVYLDGEKVNEYQGDFSGFGEFMARLGSYNGSGYYYTGDLDEVSLWQSYFGKSDVRRLYNEGVPSNIYYHRKVTSLLHWWRLGDHKKDTQTSLLDIVAKETMTR
jgi:hypothetical protein